MKAPVVLGGAAAQGQLQQTRKHAKTTLEFRGQWHPAPNGAKTGHGVVPENWELAQVSENDRALATYGWAGGAQLCLSNAFAESDQIRGQIDDLLGRGFTEDDIEVQCLRSLATCSEEHEAIMRKQWTDIEFQEGERQNEELIRHLERDFASQLAATAQRLRGSEVAEAEAEEVGAAAGAEAEAQRGMARKDQWLNIKVGGGTPSGRVYLSGTLSSKQEAGDLCLSGYDDGSGRQRWLIEEEKEGGFWTIKLLGGTSPSRRFLAACASEASLCLCSEADFHERGSHLWRIDRSSEVGKDRQPLYFVRPARSSPELHLASTTDGLKVYLSSSSSSSSCPSCSSLGGLGAERLEERWCLPGFIEGGGGRGAEAAGSSLAEARRHSSKDAIVALARSAAEGKDAACLSSLSDDDMTRVMNHNRNLGVAIDLVGCYLKNYEIDKADRVCRCIMPLCRERGGLWLFKLLNFYSTVRMKQSRYAEALEMYEEYESLLNLDPEEHWELYDTVFRNLGWIHSSLNSYEKALEYFQRCVEIKEKNGVPPHWFDQWDLGKTHARISVSEGHFQALTESIEAIEMGIALHEQVEKEDKVMRCKMLDSAGECASLLGEFGAVQDRPFWKVRAVQLHRRAFDLYVVALGRSKPLTGWCMEHLANALKALSTPEALEEAKELALQAFKVQCEQDIIKLPSVERLLASILELHVATHDCQGLAKCQDSINAGIGNLRRRKIDQAEATSFAVLLKRVAQVLLTCDTTANKASAVQVLQEALGYARQGLSQRASASASASASTAGVPGERAEETFCPRAAQQEIANLAPQEVLSNIQRLLGELAKVDPGEEAEIIDPMPMPPEKAVESKDVVEPAELLQPCARKGQAGDAEVPARDDPCADEVGLPDIGSCSGLSPTVFKDGKWWEIVD